MSLKPKARKGWYTKTLFDAAVDIGIVDPDSDKERKKYLRTEHKRAIANGHRRTKPYSAAVSREGGRGWTMASV